MCILQFQMEVQNNSDVFFSTDLAELPFCFIGDEYISSIYTRVYILYRVYILEFHVHHPHLILKQ